MKTKFKSSFLILLFSVFIHQISGQSSEHNYLKISTKTNQSGTTSRNVIQYYDGLGRPVQKVMVGITPGKQDLVILQEYDEMGREANIWLPGKGAGNGKFTDYYTLQQNARELNNDNAPYAYNEYEASPLSRIRKEYGPGRMWHNDPYRCISKSYTQIWSGMEYDIIGEGTQSKLVLRNKRTPLYNHYRTFIRDEEEKIRYEHSDKQGRIIQTMYHSIGGDTYYVYDDYGNLGFVLSPKTIIQYDFDTPYDDKNNTSIAESGYIYRYDHRNRCIAKKLPGCDWIYYIYDKADHLIFTQNGEQRKKGEWTFSISDDLNRLVLTGICKNSGITNSAYQNKIVKATFTGNGYWGYTISGFSPSNYTLLTANYYDNYDFTKVHSHKNFNYYAPSEYDTRYEGIKQGYEFKGLLTGTVVASLSMGSLPVNPTYTAYYYDMQGRLIHTVVEDYYGWKETEWFKYDFIGQITKKKFQWQGERVEDVEYNYDHSGRLLKINYQPGGPRIVVLKENTYDDLGRLKTSMANNIPLSKTFYKYNVRSWITDIDNDYFMEHLDYYYNGNIQQQIFPEYRYSYEYDGASRLKKAFFSNKYEGNFSTSYNYDENSNITHLTRWKGDGFGFNKPEIIDNLTFQYVQGSNKLKKITDTATGTFQGRYYDFPDYANKDTEYLYNTNGSITCDLNKGINSIEYYTNLNLPGKIQIKSPVAEAQIEYCYDANGNKLFEINKWNPDYQHNPVIGTNITPSNLTKSSRTDYIGRLRFDNERPNLLINENGYFSLKDNKCYFYQKDHLGNVKCVIDEKGERVGGRYEYYPFGIPFGVTYYNEKPPFYLYNEKEYNTSHGLNLYDYGARHYDPALGRFLTMDPLSETNYSVSPYVYCDNNPLKYIDIEGLTKFLAITMGNDVKYRGATMSSIDPTVEHFVLTGGVDGFVNILKGATKADPEGVGFLSLWSHGSEGMVFEGGNWSDNSIRNNDLNKIKSAIELGEIIFTDGAIIYLGGCNAGTGQYGKAFAQELADITGVAVIAANDRVGPKKESNKSLSYTTYHPKITKFHKFNNHTSPIEMGSEIDIMSLLEQAKISTTSKNDNSSTTNTWGKIMNYINNILQLNPNIQINR